MRMEKNDGRYYVTCPVCGGFVGRSRVMEFSTKCPKCNNDLDILVSPDRVEVRPNQPELTEKNRNFLVRMIGYQELIGQAESRQEADMV